MSLPSGRRRACCEPVEPRLVLAAVPVIIDLLALYTPAASSQVGGDAHVRALIESSVDMMNRALVNSDISLTIRLVHAESVAYASSGDVFTDRVRLETAGDGYMDNVFALRNAYGADLVTLISDGVGGGNADLMTSVSDPNNPNLAFSALFASGIGPGFLTLAHELGHNLGGGHERGNPTQPAVGPFPYSVGYHFPITSPELTASFNDIMSYGYGNDIPLIQYANPVVTFNGVPTGKPAGDPQSADVASTFLQTAPLVANYRATVVQDTTAPTASLFSTTRLGNDLTFTVRYTDDSALDLSTIDSADVVVSGPGGFALPAALLATDHPSVSGAYKFATYHVLLPATSPPGNSLTFTLQAGAVKDISNHPAPAGPLANHTDYYAGSPVDASGQHAAFAWAQSLGPLAPGTTAATFGSLTPDDLQNIYSFTLAAPATVSATLTGLAANADLFLVADANHNGVFDDDPAHGNVELLTDTGFNESNLDEGVGLTLPAGTYYLFASIPFPPGNTPYTLTVRAAAPDTAPPTAAADTRDLKAAGAPYVDFDVAFADDVLLNGVSTRYDAGVDIHAVLDNGADFTFYYYPDANLNSSSFADAPSKITYYRVFAFNADTGFTAAENGTYTLSIHDPGPGNPRPRDAAGNSIPANLPLGSFKISIGTPDTTRPTATLSANPPVPGQTTWSFSVLYRDNVAPDAASFDSSDLRVTGPGGYNQPATFVSAAPLSSIGSASLATYTVPASGGFWDGTDDGAYTFTLQSNQVRDAAGNLALAVSFPAVVASSPNLVALAGPPAVSFVGTAGPDTMRIDADANFVYFTLNDTLLYFVPRTSVPRFTISALGGDDAIFYQSGTLTGAVVPGPGHNSLAVTGGALTLDGDVGSASPLAATVSSGATLTLATTQHLASLSLAGTGRTILAAGGSKVLVTGSLSLSGLSVLDLSDNAAVIDYAGASPILAIRSLLSSGYAAGAWNGAPGINSSAAASVANHAIAYAEASTMGITTFAGQALDPTALLLKYTYAGDANLSGTIDSDDYALADRGKAGSLNTWVFGDFNYDGVVSAADYLLLDRSFAATHALAPTAPDTTHPSVVAPPAAIQFHVTSPSSARRGTLVRLRLRTAPASEPARPFRYAIDWDGDGRVDQVLRGRAIATVAHRFTKAGFFNVKVAVLDPTRRRIASRKSLAIRIT